jgi:choline/glycine/proline betaine transport protein
VTAIGILVSPAGRRRIGDAAPDSAGYLVWFCLVFSVGTLAGLLIWATAEPLYHLLGNPLLEKGQAETAAATAPALRLALFHWTLHPWAIFSVLGVALAWGAGRYGLPLRPSSALAPLFRGKPPAWLALPVDIVVGAIVLWGLTVTIGLGAMQVETAAAVLGGNDPAAAGMAGAEAQARATARARNLTGEDAAAFLRDTLGASNGLLAIVALLAAGGAAAAWLGVRRGLGIAAVALVACLLVFLGVIVAAGPALYIVDSWINALGDYLGNLPNMSLMTRPNQTGDAWQGWWTIFYLATWMGLAPGMGLLMASLSRGRTIRDMLLAGFVAPAVVTSMIVAVMGGGALHIELFGDDGLIEPLKQNPAFAAYEMLKTFAPAENGNSGTGLLPRASAALQIAAVVAAAAGGMLVLRRLFGQGARAWLGAAAAMLAVAAAALALWQLGGLVVWQSMRTGLFLAGLPVAVFAIAAVAGFLRPARTPGPEGVEAD